MTIDRGSGRPLVLIPGIQGRCEWLGPLIDRLETRFRVLSFSLNDVPVDRFLERTADHVDRTLDRAGEATALLVGVSFGGLVAVRYAARCAARTSRLVLCSAPSPTYRLDPQSAGYVRRPLLSLPLFAARGAIRMAPEVVTALPSWPARGAFAVRFGLSALRWPASPMRMSEWVQAWMTATEELAADSRRVTAPTLVVTGEPHLDRVVPVQSSLEYSRLIPGASHAVLEDTGHLGVLTRPEAFARLIDQFAGPVVPGPSHLHSTPATPVTSLSRTRI
jgi:pimeloyl-ACP methyl ester carboxylesterase